MLSILQECITAGCIPPTSVTVSPAMHAPLPCTPPTMHAPLPCMHLPPPATHALSPPRTPLWTEGMTHAVKILPCPKLRLRAVMNDLKREVFFTFINFTKSKWP